MSRSRWTLFLLMAVLGAGTFLGFLRLFQLRFQAGDIYPPYSSLRADPLGAKVLHDALNATSGLIVERNFRALDKIGNPGRVTIVYAGAPTDEWARTDVDQLEALAKEGARVVVTFLPTDERAKRAKNAPSATPTPENKEKPADVETEEAEPLELIEIGYRWGFASAYFAPQPAKKTSTPPMAHATSPDLEHAISWHTTLYFPKPRSPWTVLYRVEGAPVILERNWGQGSIMLAADSYFLSNEAMKKERAPGLIAHIVGSNTRIVFDETHLGVHEDPGIATLVRKFHLGAFLAAVAMLAALFVWHSSSSFLPPVPDGSDSEIVLGKDSASGFVNLLRRGISPGRLIGSCVEQWKRSTIPNASKAATLLARIEPLAERGAREPVATYRSISEILAEKK